MNLSLILKKIVALQYCEFLLCSKMNQPYVYIHCLPFGLPSQSSQHSTLNRLPCAIPMFVYFQNEQKQEDFPDGPVVKNPPANAQDMGLIPDPGGFHMPQCN